MIVFQKVTKIFPDGTQALGQVSCQIKKGEFVFFIGPSGAGKTTIMKLLRRELLASEGTVIVKDKNLAEMEDKEVPLLRRQVTMCFQDFKLLSDRTVQENIALSLEVAGLKEEEVEKRVAETLKNVGLEKKGGFFPLQLSGGELQRVGIARAIVAKPEVLLADEPTGNLDPESAWEILKLFKEINLSGTTVLVATHNAELVNKFAERVIALSKGKVVSDKAKGKYKI
ncbi:cell division ATP-binding protein FtsE [Candidatus Beckwithbacteria bacterium CG2_30_44_31]|uniref:Cell division ATP-binding protein FtsE n=1 Tax=Candidatus Beckwithbacteria bacterium CG2_30_44_31 TaxID=1805035 RepID=A0A1J5B715_9BACT|nr:MAG: cell division ATP-binding protein FtsE [Candidatus Beckwithbacteria bacterium CG2_30_44_31]